MITAIIFCNVIAIAAAIVASAFIIKWRRQTPKLWARYHPGAEYSPVWTGMDGKRYKMHIPTQQIVAA